MITKLPYSHIVDIWSMGICCYEMFYGITPFEPPPNALLDNDDTMWRKTVKNNILSNSLNFSDQQGVEISLNSKLFIRSILDKNLATRLGSRTALSNLNKSTSEHMVFYEDIQNHAFFSKLNFNLLESRKINAPPILSSQFD